MEVTMKKNDKEITVYPKGRLDTLTAPQLEETLKPEFDVIQKLIIDLSELEYISSAGLRVLLAARQKMEGKDGMIIKNVSEEVMDVFEITGFTDILDFE